ncbi:type II toxin-antitoxin system RelE/ParE family toxin [Ralstonia pseudosolanacearum]|uniref:type II toxin-antitoxin system RelE/ParE family toxin n=1 Tax=Ralstonia pseudosolanacearum TaxID=1310165 RepID=UPI0007D76908|nr:type II toxin-antitoxin system RelE/ParE family toxin [Ralstonia pseudosolanacearum]MDC6292215.1 type II toxin-antitoxin system RelE/ParE family toxin [Ralstonia pseudosolanacearum]MDD7790091.1 type II toxin-antitoxin system RelE/ParE family toxin [Ralstonia pseudosolanacearum]MDN3368583.1 type II toxin-antitoxin system RelE/ParE family toxin [Ralstonia pseudosolanacearum]OAK93155.1 RelE family toxin-antitoxin system [Ralstonia pseudosolanacearum]QOK88174.1 type II toxin-antitoxin system Re
MPLSAQRVFKTKWFNKAAQAAGISDAELHKVARQLMQGLGDDLGGNVWKKRLDQNRKRGIVLNKAGRCWFFVFLFAKSDRDNIDAPELAAFRKLASDFGRCASADLDRLVELKALVEVCHD